MTGVYWWDPWHTINIAAPLGSVMGLETRKCCASGAPSRPRARVQGWDETWEVEVEMTSLTHGTLSWYVIFMNTWHMKNMSWHRALALMLHSKLSQKKCRGTWISFKCSGLHTLNIIYETCLETMRYHVPWETPYITLHYMTYIRNIHGIWTTQLTKCDAHQPAKQ